MTSVLGSLYNTLLTDLYQQFDPTAECAYFFVLLIRFLETADRMTEKPSEKEISRIQSGADMKKKVESTRLQSNVAR